MPLGTENAFGSEPTARLQPTTFRPGHHRFQCVMVLDADFQGGLRWTLTYAGTTTSTSEDMLQYNWEFDDRTKQSVLRDVDVANAPRGVCLNRSPLVRILGLRNGPDGEPPELTVNVGDDLRLFGSTRDEGLPRNRVLVSAWRPGDGPWLSDFSLAAAIGDRVPGSGGTAAYQSASRRRGAPAGVDDDVHAFAVLVYELWTGALPFGRDPSLDVLENPGAHLGMLETGGADGLRSLAGLVSAPLVNRKKRGRGGIEPFSDALELALKR